MKKIIILLQLALMVVTPALADKIVTKDAAIIDCKVSLINDNNVVYRKPGEAFDREMERSKILKIKYDNGTEEILSQQPVATPKPVTAAKSLPVSIYNGKNPKSPNANVYKTEPDWSQFPPASRPYSIGEWYDENGVQGIVIWTTPDGRHGRILHPESFNNSGESFRFFTEKSSDCFGMQDFGNGYANWQALKQFLATHPQYSEDMFPIYKKAKQLGEGWYLPSLNELLDFSVTSYTKTKYQGPIEKFRGKNVIWGKIFDYVAKTHVDKSLYSTGNMPVSSTEVWDEGLTTSSTAAAQGECTVPQYALLKLYIPLSGALRNDPKKIVGKSVTKDYKYNRYYLFHLF